MSYYPDSHIRGRVKVVSDLYNTDKRNLEKKNGDVD